jgi:hypothetical protein
MPNGPETRDNGQRNGHATVSRKVSEAGADPELEPKGSPTSDRYRAETVHADETDDHSGSVNKQHEN